MKAAALIAALEGAGIGLMALPSGEIKADVPNRLPKKAEALLAEVRRYRGDVLALLRVRPTAAIQTRPVPPAAIVATVNPTPLAGASTSAPYLPRTADPTAGCLDCSVGATALLCPDCLRARQDRPPDPRRQRRVVADLSTRRCGACGGSWWRVSPNGQDASCECCHRSPAAETALPAEDSPAAQLERDGFLAIRAASLGGQVVLLAVSLDRVPHDLRHIPTITVAEADQLLGVPLEAARSALGLLLRAKASFGPESRLAAFSGEPERAS